MTVYATAAIDYFDRGYLPIPLPSGRKSPPPEGTTGSGGRVERVDVERWIVEDPDANIALRLPADVVGIDVDHYDKVREDGTVVTKRGLADLADFERELGPLPPTVMATSRTNGSGIRLYRVPMGTRLGVSLSSSIEVIQHSHRYVVASPSTNPDNYGNAYRWIETDSGEIVDEPPPVEELPPLPDRWLEHLRASAKGTSARAADDAQVRAFSDEHHENLAPEKATGLRPYADKYRDSHGRHDTLVRVACIAAREAAAGAYPAAVGFDQVRAWWLEVMAGEPDHRRDDEFDDAIAWAVAQVPVDPDRIAALRAELTPLSSWAPSVDTDVLLAGIELWSPDDQRPRPRPHPGMFHGPLGAFALDAANYTEADPAAIIAQALCIFGVAANRTAHVIAGNARHPAALFVLIAGATAKGRKGTSGNVARSLMEKVDPDLVVERFFGGFGSGEAIIEELAGAGQTGPRDTRAVLHETEFGALLAASGRQGATLSETIRNAWDGVPLGNRTRSTGRIVATDYHVGAIGHITAAEFHSKLAGVDVSNGMVNRWLIVWAERGTLRPDGANVPQEVFANYAPTLRHHLDIARTIGEVKRTPAAAERWAEVYAELAADEPPGALGGAISRSDAQTLRLSLAFALADGSRAIDVAHVDAAMHFWNYCRDTAAHIFGDSTGNADADRLLDVIRRAGAAGMTATEQRDLFGKHTGRADRARAHLQREGLIVTVERPTSGRPAQVSYAVARSTPTTLRSLSSLRSLTPNDDQGSTRAQEGATKATEYRQGLPVIPSALATEATEATKGSAA